MKIRKNKGITLIALVITIIVMLTIVAVTISLSIKGELFGYAGNATSKTKIARDEEQDWADVNEGLTTQELIARFTTNAKEDLAKLKLYFEGKTYEQVMSDEGKNPSFINNDIIPDASTSITLEDALSTIDNGTIIKYHNNYYALTSVPVDSQGNEVEGPLIPMGGSTKYTKVESFILSDLNRLKAYFIGKLKDNFKENGAYKNEDIIPDASTSIKDFTSQNGIIYNNNRYLLEFVAANQRPSDGYWTDSRTV